MVRPQGAPRKDPVPAPIVTPQQVFARLAQRTGLLGETFHKKRSLQPLVSALGGIRGDKLSTAHLALAARLPGYKPASLERELLEKHSLVRTWNSRGFLNLVTITELPEFLAAAGAAPRWRRFLETRSKLSPQARLRLLKRLCPENVSQEALKAGFPDASMRQVILREAAQAGNILWKDGEGSGAVFGWTKEMLGKSIAPDRDYRDVVGRYLASYGPLGAADLGAWLGVTVAAARQLMAKHHVAQVQVEGWKEPAFLRPEDVDELVAVRKRAAKGLVIVAPGDPLTLAYKTRWRDTEGDDPPGLVFVDGRKVGSWTLIRSEVGLDLDKDAPESKISKFIESLLERAGIEAKITASA